MFTLSHATQDLWMRVYYQYGLGIGRDAPEEEITGIKCWCNQGL